MSLYAIIPARGGSKGIPNKNLSVLNGRSLVEIGVKTCLGSAVVDRVFISTDNHNIKAEALKVGAEVIDRPDDISGDTASSESVLLHALGHITERGWERPDTILFYQITSALTNSNDIDNAYRHFVDSGADSLFTATQFIGCLWERIDGKVVPIHHDHTKRLRRQEMPECFSENGAFYLLNTDGFSKIKHRFFGKIEVFKMSPENKYDIDEPIDLEISEILLKRK